MKHEVRFGRAGIAALALATLGGCGMLAGPSWAPDPNALVLKRSGATCADDPNCFNRLHPGVKPVARAKPGQQIVFETRDAADTTLGLDSQFPRDLAKLNTNNVHPLSGPVHIEGAVRGDVLAVTILDIDPNAYGFTLISPIGFLVDKFPPGPPRLFNWRLTRKHAVSDQIPGVRIPYGAFPGIVTVLPGEEEVVRWRDRERALAREGGVAPQPTPDGAVPAALCGPQGSARDLCLRTAPPREHAGNLDAKYLGLGVTLLVPCYVDGCGLAVGDIHYAQGDGEVSGTAIEIEMAAKVTVVTSVLKGMAGKIKVPHLRGPSQLVNVVPGPFYATTGFPIKRSGEVPHFLAYLHSEKVRVLENLSRDLTLAAYNALIEMIDYIEREHGLSREQAYAVASVAVDLRIAQVVDGSNVGALAILPLDIFVKK
jgi:formamidase